MRLENCIRRWLGLKAHRVRQVREERGRLVAEVEAIERRLPRCGCCGRQVRRTKGRTRRRLWRDLKIRHLPLVIAYTPRRVVCPDCGVRVERIPWADRWLRVTKSLCRVVSELSQGTDLTTVGGKPNAWLWSRLRPWLEEQFGRKLPERFPTSRFL